MLPFLGEKFVFKPYSTSSDDWVDRMNHKYTTLVLLIFAGLVSSSQFVGDPIHCWSPPEFHDWHQQYIKSYCWIKNTYYIPMLDTVPVDARERQDSEITYYQWVPIILLFQAFLFKLPNVLWKILNCLSGLNLDNICRLAAETQVGCPQDRMDTIKNMAVFLDRWRQSQTQYKSTRMIRAKAWLSRILCCLCNSREGTFLTALYLWKKALYQVNVIGQFFLLNAFMATDYHMYGYQYINMLLSGESMRDSPRFPRITLCDFKIRQLQNIQRWTVQCVLPINLFNEKIFIFLWFWFAFITLLTAVNFLKWMILIVFKTNNYKFVKKYLMVEGQINTEKDKKQCRQFAEHHLRDDGCFVIRMIGANSSNMVVTDLLNCMYNNYNSTKLKTTSI